MKNRIILGIFSFLFFALGVQNIVAYLDNRCLRAFRGFGENCGGELVMGALLFISVGTFIGYLGLKKLK